MGIIADTIETHHCATVRKDGTWTCICGVDLKLPKESVLHPTQKQITKAWIEHVSDKVKRALTRAKLLAPENP